MPSSSLSDNFSTMRKAMIDSQLRPNAVEEKWILDAMSKTAREDFVPAEYRNIAYMDRSVPMGSGRYLAPPLTSALMLQKANITADDTILYIGATSGYNAQIASARAAHVSALDSIDNAAKADNITAITGNLKEGAAENAPYSLIIIEGTVEQVPQNIINQLADNGRLICGIGNGDVAHLSIGYKRADSLALTAFMECELMRFTSEHGFDKEKEFSF